ncbi:MAG: RNA-binding protein [Magnetospirillum sp.]|nr:RNA-binding protein [Magnetospirillum sp.]
MRGADGIPSPALAPAGANVEGEPDESGPSRRCIVTGQVRPKAELLRFVLSPEGEVVPDVEERLPGRGLWLSARRDVVNTAVAKRAFAKAARRAVTVPADLADRVEALLARRCLDAVGLARRAGQAVSGFEKVRAEVKGRRVGVLVEARDAAEGGRNKIRGLAPDVPVVDLFDAAELGPVFGRDAVVHVAVAPGRLASRLSADAALLAGLRRGAAVRDEEGGGGGALPSVQG